MSLGFQNGNNYQNTNPTNKFSGGNQFKSPEVHSGYALFNSSSNIPEECHSCLTFSYWKSCIKISIAKRDQSTFGKDNVSYDMDNKLSIYIRHAKARMLANELKNIDIEELRQGKTIGVGSGSAVILIGCVNDTPAIIIRKAFEDGSRLEHTYILNTSMYDIILDHDLKSFRFQTDVEKYKYIELDIIARQLEDFANSINNAIAFSVIDNMAYGNYKLNNTINSIANKLGIDMMANKNNAKFGYNSFNTTDSVSKFSTSTVEELEESIGGI